jgi:hypothetical protein
MSPDLPGDEVEECEGMNASILTRSTQRKKLFENSAVDACEMFRKKHWSDLPCSSGNTLYIAYLSNERW